MIGKLVSRTLASAAMAVGICASAMAAPVTVSTVEALVPNPNNLSVTNAVTNTALNGVTLSDFKALMEGPTGAYNRNAGGVLNFQQQFQGGSWPNAPSSTNGVDVGNGPANLITANYGALSVSNPGAAPSVQFYRLANLAGQGAIDSNTNQGTNVTSGGGLTQDGGGTASYDFTPGDGIDNPTAGVGGGYMGIPGDASLELEFVTPIRALGIAALPRGATRSSQLTFTLTDNSTIVSSTEVVGTSAVFFGASVTPAQAASGVFIKRVLFTHVGGVNRYDDLAFIAAPEPSSITLLGLAGLAAVVRRRRLVS